MINLYLEIALFPLTVKKKIKVESHHRTMQAADLKYQKTPSNAFETSNCCKLKQGNTKKGDG